jgi:hypothetical protein
LTHPRAVSFPRSRRSSLALLITLALPACLDPTEPEPAATLAASAQATSTLEVATWEVHAEGERVRVIGRDAAATRHVELIVERDPAAPTQRVRIETELPAHDTFELTSEGVIDGASSDATRALATLVFADLGHRTTPVAAGTVDGLGTASSALSVVWRQGQVDMGWSMFGYSGYVYVGDWCGGSLTRSEDTSAVLRYGTAYYCAIDWTSPIASDCHARVSYAMPGWHYDTCYWDIYVNP